MRRGLGWFLVVLAACTSGAPPVVPAAVDSPSPSPSPAPSLLATSLSPSPPPSASSSPPPSVDLENVAAVHPHIAASFPPDLASGLPFVFEVRAELFERGGAVPVALTEATCRVGYDLWDQVYRVSSVRSGTLRASASLNVEGVARNCLDVESLRAAESGLKSRQVASVVRVRVQRVK